MEPHLKSDRFRRAERNAVVTTVIFVAAMLIAGLAVGGTKTLKHATELSPGLLLILLTLSLVNYCLRATRWQLCSGALGVDVPLRLSILYYFAGFSMTMTPGKLGEILRLWFLHRAHGYRYERTVGLLIADRLFDANAMVLLMLGSVAGFAQYSSVAIFAAIAAAIMTGLLVKPTLLLPTIEAVGRFWPRRLRYLLIRIRRVARHVERLASYRLLGAVLLISAAGWLAEAEGFAILLQAMGAKASMLEAIFIFAFSAVIGGLSFLPGGLGGVEATMIGLLAAVGVSLDIAIAATAIIRLTTLWFSVALGFAALTPALRSTEKAALKRTDSLDPNPSSVRSIL